MQGTPQLRLSPWYLNTRRLNILANADIPAAAQVSLNKNSGERASAMRMAARLADHILQSGKVPSLTPELLEGLDEGDRVVAQYWGLFTFKGVSAALMAEYKGKTFKPGTVTGQISFGEDDYEVLGSLANEHVYSDTSVGFLGAKRRALVLGQFERQGDRIELFPFAIGDLVTDMSGFSISWGSQVRLHPIQIETFARAQDVPTATPAQVKRLLSIPEEYVKNAFAEIIGEPFVPKDWGGEKSDLTTSRVFYDGAPRTAAFIFKGPSVSGVMHPANMGKRGDQLVRAFEEPVELVVVQHCNQVASSVVKFAEALAASPANPKRYCIIDGADTYRILRAYGKLPPEA